MEDGRGSSLSVDLEQADDKEPLEALHGEETFWVSDVFPLRRNVHKASTLSTRGANNALRNECPSTLCSLSYITAHRFHCKTPAAAHAHADIRHRRNARETRRRVGHLMKVYGNDQGTWKKKKAFPNPFQYLLDIIAKIPFMR